MTELSKKLGAVGEREPKKRAKPENFQHPAGHGESKSDS
jgi:hypothetical protein